jgi:hypothetical protein
MSERAGVLGEDTTGFFPKHPRALAQPLIYIKTL